jgi:hypothetical protein
MCSFPSTKLLGSKRLGSILVEILIFRLGTGGLSFLFLKNSYIPIINFFPVEIGEVLVGLDFLGVSFARSKPFGWVSLK